MSQPNSNTYILDNSALNKLLKNPHLLQEFRNKEIKFIITKETYLEAHSGQVIPTFERMQILRDFNMKSSSARFYFSGSLFRVIKKESQKFGRLVRIPIMPLAIESEHLSIMSNQERYQAFKEESLAKSVEFLAGAKQRVFEHDKKESEELLLRSKVIRRLATEYAGVTEFRQIFPEFLPVFNEAISNKKMRRAIKSKVKFPYFRAYCNALILRILGNELRNFSPNDELKFLEKKKVGNWYDLYYLAWSCPEHNLLSEDKDLLGFHRFFQKKGLANSKAFTVEELLNKLKLDHGN